MALLRSIDLLPNNSDMVVFVWENELFGRQVVEGWRDSEGNLQGEYPATVLATHFVDPSEFTYEEDEEDFDSEALDYSIALISIIETVRNLLSEGKYNTAETFLDQFASIANFNAKYMEPKN